MLRIGCDSHGMLRVNSDMIEKSRGQTQLGGEIEVIGVYVKNSGPVSCCTLGTSCKVCCSEL